MRTQHNFCTQQVRYVGITMIVILFGLNLCAGSRENSFQEVLKAVLFGGWSTLSMQHHPIGTPRDKLQLRLQPMDLSLWQQELLQTKSMISGTH